MGENGLFFHYFHFQDTEVFQWQKPYVFVHLSFSACRRNPMVPVKLMWPSQIYTVSYQQIQDEDMLLIHGLVFFQQYHMKEGVGGESLINWKGKALNGFL